MNDQELQDAMVFMAKVPQEDPHFSGWNFDSETWRNKFIELIGEVKNRMDNVEKAIEERQPSLCNQHPSTAGE